MTICGNVGIINRETIKVQSDKLLKYFSQALFTDTLRGKHGTGIAGVDILGDIHTHKKAMAAPDFLDLSRTQNIISNHDNVFLSGHNRWATQGSHTDENTHPFNHDHITMFHNGTLTSVCDLPDGNKFIVDSNAIAHALSVQSVKKTLEDLDGAYALVWYDSDRQSINFARNKERPLWFGKLKNSDSFIYASEKEMLEWLSNRNSITLDKIYELPVGQHIEVPLDLNDDVAITAFEPKEFDYHYGPYGGYSKPKTTVTAPKNASSIVGKIFSCYAQVWNKYPSNDNLGALKVNLLHEGKSISCYISSLTRELGISLVNRTINVKITSNTQSGVYGTYIPELSVVDSIADQAKQELAIIEDKEEEAESALVTERQYNTIIDESGLSDSCIRVGPDLNLITQSKYDELTKHGCSNCSADISDEDDCDITWDVMDNPFCPSCAKTELYV